MEKYIAIVSREEENLVAVVTYKSSKELNQNSMMDLITKAVTEWIDDTEEGKRAWEHSLYDFNIGDLSNYLNSIILRGFLHANDIWELNIEIVGNGDYPTEYVYDTVLVCHPE
jgi:hypothetical protein